MKILIYSIAVFLVFLLYVRFLEFSTAFAPNRTILQTPKKIGLFYEDVYLKTPDQVTLHGWMVKSTRNPSSKTTLLFLHGNAGNVGDRLEKIDMFQNLGLHVFIFDYRGYGVSQGRPTEQGLYADAQTAFDYLRLRPEGGAEKIVVYGESLGGVPAVHLATQRLVAGLILDSTLVEYSLHFLAYT